MSLLGIGLNLFSNATSNGVNSTLTQNQEVKAAPVVSVPVGQSSQIKTEETSLEQNMVKKGPGLDDTLTKFYGKKYTQATEEEKEKLIVKYFDWLSKDKKDTISQLDQFKLYRDRCTDEAEYKRLSSVIDKMEAGYQVNAAKTVITQGTDKQKHIGRKAVADDYQNYDKANQNEVLTMVVDSKDEEAIKIAATHTAQLDKANQVGAVKIFQGAEIAEDAQKAVDKVIIDQYGQFAKENQVDIHKIMSSSKFSETVVYAASNIWNFDKDNQAPAVKITSDTKNQEAINAAAAQWQKYDKTAQAEIKTIIQNSESEIAKQTLAQEELKSESKTQKETEIKENKSEVKAERIQTKEEKKSQFTVKDVKEIIKSKSSNKILFENSIENLSDTQKISLITSLSGQELYMVLNIILKKNPSMSVLAKVSTVLSTDPSELSKTSFYDTMLSKVSLFNTTVQKSMIQQSAKDGKLNKINTGFLCVSSRREYQKQQQLVTK